MKLDKNQKLIVGTGTLWMLAYPFIFLCVWFAMFATILATASARREPPPALFGIFFCTMPFHFLTIAISIALMIFYWAHIIKNNGASDTWRIIFGVTIFWFGYFAMPIYFYFFVWRDEIPQWARTNVLPAAPAQTDANIVAI